MRNTLAADPVEQARGVLRAAVARSSVRAVAREAGVDHTRLAAFVAPDSAVRPRGAMLAAVLAYVDRRAAAQDGANRGVPSRNTTPASFADVRDTPAYWLGVQYAAREMTAKLLELQNEILQHSAVFARAGGPTPPFPPLSFAAPLGEDDDG